MKRAVVYALDTTYSPDDGLWYTDLCTTDGKLWYTSDVYETQEEAVQAAKDYACDNTPIWFIDISVDDTEAVKAAERAAERAAKYAAERAAELSNTQRRTK